MALNIEPLPGKFGIQVSDIDIPNISVKKLRDLLFNLYEHRVVVLKTQGLTKEEYIAFAKRAGDPIPLSTSRKDFPEIAMITNVDKDTTQEKRGAAHWHTDQSFKETVSSITMLYSVQAPDRGGETMFCDMKAAYDTLADSVQEQIDDLIVEHRHGVSVTARPSDHVPIPPRGWDQSTTVCHPLVRKHPITGQKTLYAITGTSQGIKGMEQNQAKNLLQDLCDHTFQDQFITQHAHSVHDLVMWDNPTTMHSATQIPAATGSHDTRTIHRISLVGYPSFFTN